MICSSLLSSGTPPQIFSALLGKSLESARPSTGTAISPNSSMTSCWDFFDKHLEVVLFLIVFNENELVLIVITLVIWNAKEGPEKGFIYSWGGNENNSQLFSESSSRKSRGFFQWPYPRVKTNRNNPWNSLPELRN
jgi:hypothetical protein